MDANYRFGDWFGLYWSRAALPMAVVLLLISPLLYKVGGLAGWLIFLLLPIYMVHQYEEHAQGRFKAEIEAMLPSAFGPIKDGAIFVVNIGLVWVAFLIFIYLAYGVAIGLGLSVAYATVLNGLLHIGVAVRQRRYNAGLWTSLLLFLPVGGYTLYVLNQVPLYFHVIGVSVAVLIHIFTLALILGSARRRAKEGGS